MPDQVSESPSKDEPWVVLGSSGFVGQGITKVLRQRGIETTEMSAPRLEADPSMGADDLILLAERSDVLDELVSQFRGAKVVINAAGMATPDGNDSRALYGANALLPALVAMAAVHAGVERVILLSSAAVQGNRLVLDESVETEPFSPYSRSKALGESATLAFAKTIPEAGILIIRATSVQGIHRSTTRSLRRIARTPLASVASPGTQQSVVSSLEGLSTFVADMAVITSLKTPAILIQPWEGANVADVLSLAGGKPPIILPAWLCRTVVSAGKFVGRKIPRIAGITRRIEVMWFGQRQVEGLAVNGRYITNATGDAGVTAYLSRTLSGGES